MAVQICAHRGAAGSHPENTIAAFEEAMRLGVDGILTNEPALLQEVVARLGR